MSRYILAPAAQEDLVAIRDYYLKEAGFRVARQMLVEFAKAFQTIARTPGIGQRREDLPGDRPVVFWPMRDYLLVYRVAAKPLEIITIARGSRDIAVILRRRE